MTTCVKTFRRRGTAYRRHVAAAVVRLVAGRVAEAEGRVGSGALQLVGSETAAGEASRDAGARKERGGGCMCAGTITCKYNIAAYLLGTSRISHSLSVRHKAIYRSTYYHSVAASVSINHCYMQ